MSRLLFIHCDEVDTFGVAPEAAAAAGAEVRVWDALDPGEDRPDLSRFDGVVLFGSTYNVEHADEQPFIKDVRELTLHALDRQIPFLGVCFGAQVLAWALDGHVGKAPAREVGFERIHLEPAASDDPLLAHYREGDMGFQWHMDTFEPPVGAELLATGDRVHHQAFRLGRQAWGIQWHLEIDRPEMETWLDIFGAEGDLLTEWGKSADEVRAEADAFMASHEDRGRELFTRFAEVVQGPER